MTKITGQIKVKVEIFPIFELFLKKKEERGNVMMIRFSILQNVFHFMKTLMNYAAKGICFKGRTPMSAISAAAILALTASGFGGRGQSVLTAFAEPPAAFLKGSKQEYSEETKTITKAATGYSKHTQSTGNALANAQPVMFTEASHFQSVEYELEKAQVGIQTELSASRRYGQMVVGYLLTQEVQQKEEIRETALSEIAEVKEQILAEKQKAAEEASSTKTAGISYSADDYEILLRIVQAEAGICDSKGKILVANVIINRVRSKEFPDTIRKVVYQPSQFSPVSNGTIDRCTVTSETVECVRRALSGEDYSQGALYFMNRKAARDGAARWFDGKLNYLFRHGGHEFFK